MTCVHLKQLFTLCKEHDLKLSGSDLIRVVCNQCGEQEVCPNTMTNEYDAKQSKQAVDKESTDKRPSQSGKQ